MSKFHRYIPILAFCILAGRSQAQPVTDSLLVEGHYRTFVYNHPTHARPGASLMFMMHGSGGDPQGFMRGTGRLEEIARGENLIVVYPAGYKRYWNECRKASTALANKENINEEAFFSAMIDHFYKKFKINKSHVFASGLSGGGHMSYKLAMTMPDKIRAVSIIVASLPSEENLDCAPVGKAIPVMITNGTGDTTNPYEGGEVKTSGVTLGNVRSTDESFQYWAKLNGYSGSPARSTLPDLNTGNDITVEKYSYQQKGKPEVTLLKVVNGKHEFPKDIDFFAESWAFFKRTMGK